MTIEIMQHRPDLVALLRQSPLVMMPLREIAIAALDGGRGPLKGAHPPGGPCLPLLKGLAGQPLGEHVGVKRRLACRRGLAQPGFSAGTARVRHLVVPLDTR
jgi:hypothetical protein